jgi:hypothetical protein
MYEIYLPLIELAQTLTDSKDNVHWSLLAAA